MKTKQVFYVQKQGMTVRVFTPSFPSRLSKLIVQQNDDTIRENLRQRVQNMCTDDKCPCGSGKSKKNCCHSMSNDSILAELFVKYAFVDQKIAEETHKQAVTTFCKKRCNDCCYEYFYFSMAEYFAIRLELINKNMLGQAIATAKVQLDEMKETHPMEYAKLHNKNIGQDVIRRYHDNEFTYRYELCPCNINGECAVYNSRAFVCRIFGVTNQFTTCPKLYKRVKCLFSSGINQKRARKYVIALKFDLAAIKEGLDIIPYKDSPRILRPFPLIYWLCHDEEYETLYNIALSKTKTAYFKAVHNK